MTESLSYDIVIVGAGPAGLASAIQLAKLNQQHQTQYSICVLEKGAYVGAHIVSGCVFDPRSLNKLIPEWHTLSSPIQTPVNKEKFMWLTAKNAIPLPIPPQMRNHGNYLISLSQLCQWLGEYATRLGVEIIPGYAAQSVVTDAKDQVVGITTGEMGRNKDHSTGPQYQPGVTIYAQQIVLAEGCKGSLTEHIIEKYQLRHHAQPQNYALGVKEVWRVDTPHNKDGLCVHTMGFPLHSSTYGGGFIYHYQNKIAIGMIVGLDYTNPTLDPQGELQRLKMHPWVRKRFDNAQCIAYGARALNEGGYQAIPQLHFPGGIIVGCAAGFLNVAQLKGTHNAIESGIQAATAIHANLSMSPPLISSIGPSYEKRMHATVAMRELKRIRNIRPGFYHGRLWGLINAAFETVTFGHTPWTLSLSEDRKHLQPLKTVKKINYPKPDGKLILSKLDALRLSGTNHSENQPCHLVLSDPGRAVPVNYQKYGGPEQYYCPANVYEYIQDGKTKKLQINAQNCIHCKTCAIKDPTANIQWIPPQGGEGPKYSET
jgi:electron-transferring-flavoprotein dehydrogenase